MSGPASIVEEVLPAKRIPVENSMTIEDSGDVTVVVSGSPQRSFIEKKCKMPTFLLERTMQAIRSTDKRARLEGFSDLKAALPFPYVSPSEQIEKTNYCISIIRKCLHVEVDNTVKQRIIECLSLFAQCASVHSKIIVEDIINQFHNTSSSVIASLLRALEIIFSCKTPSSSLIKTIEDICLEQLQSRKVIVRKQALSLLCKVSESSKLQLIFSRSCELDPDPRVRCMSFQGILTLHQRGFLLDIDLYRRAVEGMSDDNEQVKLCALELMWTLCNLHPLHIFTTKNAEKTRLVDDDNSLGFIRICNMVNDISFHVRAKASRLLGGLRNVSTQYLLQAFSKELFGRGNKLKLSRTKSNDVSAAGDFDLTQCADINVLDSGAGAFVHGLEDEYYQVRMATIDSICELSCGSPQFARIAVEFLVDMFNDEINAVRINSIHSLRKISSHIQLNEEQLQIALSALEDVTPRLRFAMQQLLMAVSLSNLQSVHISIQGLLNNLKKYPEDKENIFQALQGIGLAHSHFMEYTVENLLNIDLNFAQMEANVNDVFYIARLIVVCNASSKNPHILSLLPKHTARHYRYLKDKYPKFFPPLLPFGDQNNGNEISKENQLGNVSVDLPAFFTSTWGQILTKHQSGSGFDTIVPLMEGFTANLQNISRTHGHLASSVDFYSLLHRALSLMLQAQFHQLKEETSAIAPELLKLSYHIEETMVGLENKDIIELHLLRLFSHTLAVIASLSHQNASETFIRSGIEDLMKRINLSNSFCEQRKMKKPNRLMKLTDSIVQLSSHSDDAQMTNNLLNLLKSFRIHPFIVKNRLKTISGRFISPQPNSEYPMNFNPSVPLLLDVKAEITNLLDTCGLMILCTYPDHRQQLFPIQERNIIPVTRSLSQLQCKLAIESNHSKGWTEQNSITLQLVRAFETNLPEFDNRVLQHQAAPGAPCFVPFGQPLLYHIFPKQDYFPSKNVLKRGK